MTQSKSHAPFSDETLMAFADGELDAEITARIEAAMETDNNLMARVALFMETRAAAQDALRPMLDEPLPEALLASVYGMVEKADKDSHRPLGSTDDNVVSLKPISNTRKISLWVPASIAATILAVTTGIAGYFIGEAAHNSSTTGWVADLNEDVVKSKLETLVSGKPLVLEDNAGILTVAATFLDKQGRLCREFEIANKDQTGYTAIACHEKTQWQLQFVMAKNETSQNYVPASGAETLDSYLSTIGAQPPLSTEAEMAALRKLLQ